MSTFLALVALGCVVLWSIIATVELVARDGYGRIPFDPNHVSAGLHATR